MFQPEFQLYGYLASLGLVATIIWEMSNATPNGPQTPFWEDLMRYPIEKGTTPLDTLKIAFMALLGVLTFSIASLGVFYIVARYVYPILFTSLQGIPLVQSELLTAGGIQVDTISAVLGASSVILVKGLTEVMGRLVTYFVGRDVQKLLTLLIKRTNEPEK